ncbi:hypothetical protein FZEAL_3818 [Fusarium zealandicum]|uniref:Uncharacterized protein n=1 Tax=Fusarium zealandicum TaxID=1053134 RepID=A0A8H4UNQ1_9HYPO|nr:hypothetical protein FZEAL_3818 [Fusarium zealandicum]
MADLNLPKDDSQNSTNEPVTTADDWETMSEGSVAVDNMEPCFMCHKTACVTELESLMIELTTWKDADKMIQEHKHMERVANELGFPRVTRWSFAKRKLLERMEKHSKVLLTGEFRRMDPEARFEWEFKVVQEIERKNIEAHLMEPSRSEFERLSAMDARRNKAAAEEHGHDATGTVVSRAMASPPLSVTSLTTSSSFCNVSRPGSSGGLDGGFEVLTINTNTEV